jgi:hypothetical protein
MRDLEFTAEDVDDEFLVGSGFVIFVASSFDKPHDVKLLPLTLMLCSDLKDDEKNEIQGCTSSSFDDLASTRWRRV